MGYGLQRRFGGICSTAKSHGRDFKAKFSAHVAARADLPASFPPKGLPGGRLRACGELRDGAYQYRVEHRVAAERWSRHAAAPQDGRHALLPRWEHDGVRFAPRVETRTACDRDHRREAIHHAAQYRGNEETMPRQAKGPYLFLRRHWSDGRPPAWIVRDRIDGRRKDSGTGLGADATQREKDEALAKYLASKHDPRPKSGRNPNEALVADCLSVYVDKKEKRFTPAPTDKRSISRQKEDRTIARRLTKFFGLYTVGEVSGELQEEYSEQRCSQSSARRELSFLAAAINSYNKKKGGMNMVFSPVLPEALPARERWLTRQEAARLLRTAWRARQKNRGGEGGRYVGKHVARFILIGLYTGTRAGAICGAALTPAIGRGHVDLDGGKFYRKALGAHDTNKRQPTLDIPPRLVAHMRRWKRLGISNHSVIEWCGKPVQNVRRGFVAARDAASLDEKVIPHTLRHTAVSWYLQAGIPASVVADYVGMSEHILKKVYKHHMPGHFDPIMKGAHGFGRTDGNRVLGGGYRHPFVTRTGERETNKPRRNEATIIEKKREVR
jgi:integrase